MKRIDTIIKDGLKNLLRKAPIVFGGVLLLVLALVVIYGVPKLYFHYLEPTASFVSDKERIETEDQLRRTVLQILGGVVVVIGLYLTYRRIKASERQVEAFRKQITVAEDGQITERFTRAVEQLGNENIHIRLGGIYALERLANDSDRDHTTIMEILAAFVRERRPLKSQIELGRTNERSDEWLDLEEDIYAVLTVLGRRRIIAGEEPPNLNKTNFQRVMLEGLRLPGVSLIEADLRLALLERATLAGANLWQANLEGAWLGLTDFQGAEFSWAELTDARLPQANLQEATFYGTILERAHLATAQLQRAQFEAADLQGAILTGANFEQVTFHGSWLSAADFRAAVHLTAEQLSQATTLFEAKLDPELETELRETHPHLFEKPEEDEEDDEEKNDEETD